MGYHRRQEDLDFPDLLDIVKNVEVPLHTLFADGNNVCRVLLVVVFLTAAYSFNEHEHWSGPPVVPKVEFEGLGHLRLVDYVFDVIIGQNLA